MNYGEDLAALIREVEQQGKPGGQKVGKAAANPELDKLKAVSKPAETRPKVKSEPKPKKVGRRASNISKEQVQQAFEEHRKRQEAKAEPEKPAEPQPELKIEVDPPRIQDGIHWTVIHSPEAQARSPSPAKVTAQAAPASNGVVKPIPSYAVAQPFKISKTATPQPFRPVQAGRAGQPQPDRPHYSSVGLSEGPKEDKTPVPAPRSPQLAAPPTSYIVRSCDANITTSTDLQTTVTRQYTELLAAPHPDTIDQSTSPIPTIRLHRHTSHEAGKADAGTSPIKIQEPRSWVPTSGVRIHEPTGPDGGPHVYRTLTTSPKPFQKSMATSPMGGGQQVVESRAAYQADQEVKPLSQDGQYRQADQEAKPLPQQAPHFQATQATRAAYQADQQVRQHSQEAQAGQQAKPLPEHFQPSQAGQQAKPLPQQAQYRQAGQADYQLSQADQPTQADQPAKPLSQQPDRDHQHPVATQATPQRPVWQRRQPSSDLDPDQPILDQDQVGRPQPYPGLEHPSLSEPSQVNPELARMDQVGRPQAYTTQVADSDPRVEGLGGYHR